MATNGQILVFEPDLFFSSKIEGVARKMGFEITIIANFEELRQELENTSPRLLILNLDSLESKLREVQRFARGRAGECLGYYSHVNARLAEEARGLAIGTAVARGAFLGRFEDVLKRVSGP